MRVLGVDPGLTRCGLGVVEGSVGRPLRLVSVEVVRTPADADLAARLLSRPVGWTPPSGYAPDAVAVERVFSQHNVRTVMGTAQAGAVAIAAPPPGAGCPSPCTRRARSRPPSPGPAGPTRRRSAPW